MAFLKPSFYKIRSLFMKKVLCFGDSNTYGFIPESKRRYDENIRWAGILKSLLGSDYEIVEAGCNNRTAFKDNPFGDEVTGYKILPKYLDETFDIVILSIGINDSQPAYDADIETIKQGMESFVDLAKALSPNSKFILVSPARLSEAVLRNGYFSKLFDKKSVEKSMLYSSLYEKIAADKGCIFVDWDKIVTVSDIDGLHFSAESHKKIALAMKDVITNL